ncbi:MAG TPA: tetratricopeptide repeat-containing glycosyltransferase family protein, partial [Chloroflexota bacterium]
NNRGTLLQELGRPREAVAAYRQALAIRPHYPEALHNLSEALQDLHQMRDAIATCEQALALDPEFADAHCGLAFALLREGDLKRGFEQYEWRFRRRDYLPLRRELQGPAWQGEDLKGKIVLLYVEPAQGFGDTLQFARFAPELAARGAMVLVECQPALVRLFGSLAGAAGIVSLGGHLPAFDLQASLMSLPYLLGTTLETIPASVPYLAPPADVQTRWRKRLGAGGAFRVGLVWATHPGHERRRSPRTLALDALTPLASIPRIQLFSLQKGAASLPADMGLIDLGPELGDFADTGAAIMNLDLVISVDTAVAHLAGALGRPVWTMLPFAAEWRWQLERRDSPWYPSMRLFRQPIWGDWTSVVAEVAAGLASLARS